MSNFKASAVLDPLASTYSEEDILIARDVSKAFGDLQVLEKIDLQIHRNEIVAIVGKSGSGKSTLLHILGTLDSSDSGSIIIDGTDVTSLNDKEIARFRNQEIGFVFQFHHLLGEFTALENVCIPGYINGLSKHVAVQKAQELLSYLDLQDRLSHKPNELSGGEQQRVAIARALINDPKIIFADEPTGNLDDATSRDVFQLILRLRKDFGQTFVLVTHNKEIAGKCDRTLQLVDKHLNTG